MQGTAVVAPRTRSAAVGPHGLAGLLPAARIGPQWLPLNATVPRRLVITFSAPAACLSPLAPAPLSLDVRDGRGFLSVCALAVKDMGVVGSPRFLRFDNDELLYRLAVRLDGQPSFLTLRSDVTARAMATLGSRFSHYRPRRATLTLVDDGCRFLVEGSGARLTADLARRATALPDSVFRTAADATEFLLGMRFSVGVYPDGRVQVQPIAHPPWTPEFLLDVSFRSAYLDALARALDAPLAYDSTLVVERGWQRWGKTKRL